MLGRAGKSYELVEVKSSGVYYIGWSVAWVVPGCAVYRTCPAQMSKISGSVLIRQKPRWQLWAARTVLDCKRPSLARRRNTISSHPLHSVPLSTHQEDQRVNTSGETSNHTSVNTSINVLGISRYSICMNFPYTLRSTWRHVVSFATEVDINPITQLPSYYTKLPIYYKANPISTCSSSPWTSCY